MYIFYNIVIVFDLRVTKVDTYKQFNIIKYSVIHGIHNTKHNVWKIEYIYYYTTIRITMLYV